MNADRWKPAVEKRWLFLASGLTWTAVGVVLCILACSWLRVLQRDITTTLAVPGMLMALPIYRFGFSRLARKNIARIALLPRRVCLFAFQDPKAYVVATLMSGLGIALRSSPIPKPLLAIVYLGIGGGLFLSSLHYYARLRRATPAA